MPKWIVRQEEQWQQIPAPPKYFLIDAPDAKAAVAQVLSSEGVEEEIDSVEMPWDSAYSRVKSNVKVFEVPDSWTFEVIGTEETG